MALPNWLRATEGGVTIDVWVVPGASRTEVTGTHDGALRVRVAAPPEGGNANRTLQRHLRRLTGGRISIAHGHGSRRKTIRIEGVDPGRVLDALDAGSPP